ncbi:ribosomal protein S6 [Ascobolus immersus RN42]|uniref:Small ribosomal subunit protein bS6m n=1 Tax=Ascobolus immersus RN42 TaxID=1160509 RepID=A0A3N4HKW3_ASCIM|nr:ribosomal protein S6 [Ascobolus immersus RN42]
MLYELIAVVRPTALQESRELARTAGTLILSNGGVIRGLTNWGKQLLPKRVKKNQATYVDGHYFVMRFDAGVEAQRLVRNTLGLDPRVVRFSVVRMDNGAGLRGMSGVGGRVWGGAQ